MRTLIVDTEFTAFTAEAKLLSIAVVDVLTGAYFYAEITDPVFSAVGAVNGQLSNDQRQGLLNIYDDFVIDTVLSQFNYAVHGISLEMAAHKLKAFLEGFATPVQLASDAITWDYPMLEQLLANAWPNNLPRLMSQMIDISAESEAYWDATTEENPHHALKDALKLAAVCREIPNSY